MANRKIYTYSILTVLVVSFAFNIVIPIPVHAAGPSPVALGGAANFVVLSEAAITDIPTSIITGNIGASPIAGSAIGVPCGEMTGTIYDDDAGYTGGGGGSTACRMTDGPLLTTAVTNMTTAYGVAAGATPVSEPIDTRTATIGLGSTFLPGIYKWSTNLTINGNITLSGGPTDVWIFQIAGDLTTASGGDIAGGVHVNLTGGALASNVFWAVAGAVNGVTLGTYSTFNGNILSAMQITMQTGAILNGRALSQTQVALHNNTISLPTTATLNVIKHVTNNNGGAATANAWTLTVASSNGGTGTGNALGSETGTTYTLQPGMAYGVTETGGVSGYSSSSTNDCTIASAVAGTPYTCTITNDDIAPVLHLRKTVTNDNGGTALNTAWTLAAVGTLGSPTNLSGTTPVDSGTSFKADTYTLAESGGPAGYTPSAWVCVGGTQIGSTVALALGQSATCTITNNDIAPRLTVTKTVNNTHGGTKAVVNFPLFIDGMSVTSGVASTTSVGLHTISETSDPGYTPTVGGDCAANGTITLAPGDVKACTIINDDIPHSSSSQTGMITVIKTVVNDNGGTKTVADFPLFVNGTLVVSGITNTFPASTGVYTVTETSDANYTRAFSGACDSNGRLGLSPGDQKICVITNDDIGTSAVPPMPPLIDVVKIPSPLALPNGPGPVTYTYTLRNIGTVPVTNITMVGDTCSPIVLSSGDTNNDQKLDVNETWVYHCTTTLSKTHTNTVTTTGWANGLSAVDIANATVVVGASIVPPLIHITKVPNPLTLTVGGESVTYIEKVTNPGTVALSNVTLVDDKCSPMKHISGDTNNDKKLEVDETWVYTCRTNLNKTTTNTATATGDANGLTAKDFAIATVVVANPKFPNAGFPPRENGTWDSFLTADILLVVLLSLYVARKKHVI
jgi:hypothetical protein